MKQKSLLIIVLIFSLCAPIYSQGLKNNILDNMLKLHPVPKISDDAKLINIISELMSYGTNFKYYDEISDQKYVIKKVENGYDIIIIDKLEKKQILKNYNNRTIKIRLKEFQTYDRDKPKNFGFFEIINLSEILNFKINDASPSNFFNIINRPNMLIDDDILGGVLPYGQTKILNRQTTRTFCITPDNHPADVFCNISDAIIIPDNGGNSAKVLTIDNCMERVMFSDKDFIPNYIGPYFISHGERGTGIGQFMCPEGITYGAIDENGYRRIYFAEYGNNRIQFNGYKFDMLGPHWITPSNAIIRENLNAPNDIVFNKGINPLIQDDDVLWFSELGYRRGIRCIPTIVGGEVYSFDYYIWNGISYPVCDAPRLDVFSDYINNTAKRSMLAFLDRTRNRIVLIRFDNNFYPSSNPPQAFDVIDFQTDEQPTSVHFVTDLPGTIDPISLYVTSNDLNGNGHIHKFKILYYYDGYGQWVIPYAAEYLASTNTLVKDGIYSTPFKKLKGVESQYNYVDIFSYENWDDQYGLRRFKQGVDVISNNWSTCYYRNTGINLNTRIVNPVNVHFDAFYQPFGQTTWDPVDVYLNGIPSHDTYFISGNNFINVKLILPTNLENPRSPVNKIKIKARLSQLDDVNHYTDLIVIKDICNYEPPPPGGCPFISINDGNSYELDNNILHRSEFPENLNKTITDKYLLNVYPYIEYGDSSINLKINELNNDFSYLDRIKMFTIDHPIGTKCGITENNNIVVYYPNFIISPDEAFQDSTDITDILQYDTTNTNIPVEGDEGDNFYISYSNGGFLKSFKTILSTLVKKSNLISKINSKYKLLNNNIILDSFAVIMDPDGLRNLGDPSVKDFAGTIIGYDTYQNYQTQPFNFSKRQNFSTIILPLSSTYQNIDSISIYWNGDYEVSFVALTPIFFGGYVENELLLIEATHSTYGNIADQLFQIDSNFATLDSLSEIYLKFKIQSPIIDTGWIRDYLFVVDGYYINYSDNNMHLMMNQTNKNESSNIPKNYNLSQNYPNPFNSSTIIKYDLPKGGLTTIKVYDILGREIIQLVNEEKEAGYHSINFYFSELASGIYFYRIQSRDFVKTKKMLLLK